MITDDRYKILFEPIKLGPVTAPNRFYQVPHCNGMGHQRPNMLAAMRGMKAEGGWGVVCTEEVEIHPASEVSPYAEGRLWDDRDIPAQARMVEAVHAHGALAGIEITHNGLSGRNLFSRIPAQAPSETTPDTIMPQLARAMDKTDIRNLRRWHREAALRAQKAGFDLVYVYAGHELSTAMHFMMKRYNHRTDEYGGSLENRTRLFRELIDETKDAVGNTCAVAVRLAVDQLIGSEGLTHNGEGRDIVELLAELPDLWDVNVADWSNDSVTARFADEGYQENQISFVKSLTTKPVVGVGRYTSPDRMASLVRKGVLDLIGAARPSIADPFLPKKIGTGRIEDIRECIGCNICVTGDMLMSPIRCTQNPTMGEEWRRGWHPEKIEPRHANESVLVVGAGPAGLEAALAAANRGYAVTLVDQKTELGGRLLGESKLPGLASYARVKDHRIYQLQQKSNVDIFLDSQLTTLDILEFQADHILLATGSKWLNDGTGRTHWQPLAGLDDTLIYTPDNIQEGNMPTGSVVLFDDDHYYMGGVLAELLQLNGCQVTFVTSQPLVSAWTEYTMEQHRIQKRLMEIGVAIMTSSFVQNFRKGSAIVQCVFTARESEIPTDAGVLVTRRAANRELYDLLKKDVPSINAKLIGDAWAPGLVAQAVYDGHKAARHIGQNIERDTEDPDLFRREMVTL